MRWGNSKKVECKIPKRYKSIRWLWTSEEECKKRTLRKRKIKRKSLKFGGSQLTPKIQNLNLKSLRKEISIVDQNTTLFDDTIFNNIKYAKPEASDEEIFTAAKISMCTDFIEKLENKFQTVIGENGVKLSGGEKQRLSIARALLKDSKIILLDEATSSLDSETEEKIQKAIEELTKNKTTVVIAHRLSTILNSEKIYVVDKGSVESSGKHLSLIHI